MAFQGRVALVTGAASGMGQRLAVRLAEQGALVAAVDLNEAGLKETADLSDRIRTYSCDVTDQEQVQQLVDTVVAELGPIDRLAHAAGIMPAGRISDVTVDQYLAPMKVNYFGTVTVTKAVLPAMLERGSGEVIIFGSVTGYAYSTSFGAYGASKAAVNAFAEVLMNEHRDSGVKFLLAAPPAVRTPLLDQAMAEGPKAFKSTVQADRLASPDSVLDAIEKALRKGRPIALPGEARAIWAVRRLAPRTMWRLVNRFNKD